MRPPSTSVPGVVRAAREPETGPSAPAAGRSSETLCVAGNVPAAPEVRSSIEPEDVNTCAGAGVGLGVSDGSGVGVGGSAVGSGSDGVRNVVVCE